MGKPNHHIELSKVRTILTDAANIELQEDRGTDKGTYTLHSARVGDAVYTLDIMHKFDSAKMILTRFTGSGEIEINLCSTTDPSKFEAIAQTMVDISS